MPSPNDGDGGASAATSGPAPDGSGDAPAAAAMLPRSSASPEASAESEPTPTTVTVTVTPRESRDADRIPEDDAVLAQIDVSEHESFWFRTPSKNITCMMSAPGDPDADATARCTIVAKAWSSPEKPSTCTLEWGSDLEVDGNGRSGFLCAGDTVLGASHTVDYGTRLVMKPGLTCSVTTDGVACANRFSNQGFFLARERYRVF